MTTLEEVTEYAYHHLGVPWLLTDENRARSAAHRLVATQSIAPMSLEREGTEPLLPKMAEQALTRILTGVADGKLNEAIVTGSVDGPAAEAVRDKIAKDLGAIVLINDDNRPRVVAKANEVADAALRWLLDTLREHPERHPLPEVRS